MPTGHEFLKLHGGINWWVIRQRLTYLQFGYRGELEKKWEDYAAAQESEDMPVILEPSAYKYNDPIYRFLEPQWKKLFERLCEADVVIVVGYSLPEGDTQARSKILTAFQTNPECRWLIVDPSDFTRERYRRLLGTRSLRFHPAGLAGFNNDIQANLQEAFPEINFSEVQP